MSGYTNRQKMLLSAIDIIEEVEFNISNKLGFDIGGSMLANIFIRDALSQKQSELYEEVELLGCDGYSPSADMEQYFHMEEVLVTKTKEVEKLRRKAERLGLLK